MMHSQVQTIAKKTMEYIKEIIRPGMSLREIRNLCESRMLKLGADSFWYWDIGAFVFAGDETCVSVSGREYKMSDRVIEENDIITIDLSPQKEGIWGDYARTIILEGGRVVEGNDISRKEWKDGLEMEQYLHDAMCSFVTPDTTFEELYFYINGLIKEKGYLNLDFQGNLGHSIVKEKQDRVYIEDGNKLALGDVSYFTFEPHISIPESKYGYKREDIYYFENGLIKSL